MEQPPLLAIRDLSVNFPSKGGLLQAVRNLDLPVPAAAISCLVGESGCGKSLTCRAILRLTPDYAILGGQIMFAGQDLLRLSERRLERIRGAKIGSIFQEPMTSLNPVLTVGMQTAEPLRLHLGMGRNEARAKVIDLFRQVGIPSPQTRLNDYPHQLSGGMRQRVMIAMALACGPDLLLADEPTTALDATIQGQILRLILRERAERGMAVLLITHDLGVVAETARFAGVMYAGMLMEYADVPTLFRKPLHPYTQGLIACQPGCASLHAKRLPTIPGTVPALTELPQGCPFQPRCGFALPVCAEQPPPAVHDGGHMTACWLYA